MAVNSLSVPFPIFNDVDGDPLDNGYIYVGTVNLNAESNPIQVYFDEALSIPAAQPVRTLNGYPTNSGAPVRLYVDADDYSITVKNKKGLEVYSSLTSTDRFSTSIISGQWPASEISGQLPSSQVEYTPPGTGAVTTTVQDKLQESVSIADFDSIASAITYAKSNNKQIIIYDDVTIQVPTDAATLQDVADYTIAGADGITVTVNIQSGHGPTEGFNISNRDCSNYRITATDSTVTLDLTFDVADDFISVVNGRGPVLACLIDAQGRCRYGVSAQQDGYIYVESGCGVKNALERGIYANIGSTVLASGSVFTGVGSVGSPADPRGAWISRGSTLIAEQADFSDSAGYGVYASRASTIHAMGLTIENSVKTAVWIHRSSRFTAHSVDGINTSLSNASGAFNVVNIDRTSIASMNAEGGGSVTITQKGTGYGVNCGESCNVNLFSASINTTGSGKGAIYAGGMANVSALSCNIGAGWTYGIESNGANVNATNATIVSADSFGVFAKRSFIILPSASVTGSGSLDLNVTEGSTVCADSCTVSSGPIDTNFATNTNHTTANSVYSSRGVLYT